MRVVFADATEGFSPTRKLDKPCGGILNSLTTIPRFLAQNGMDVTVKSSFSEVLDLDGVKYQPMGHKEKLPKWDVLVVNRNGINLPLVRYAHSIGSKVVWWLHDIVDMRYLTDSAYREVDGIIALSDYCKYSYSRFYDIPESKFVVIPNGVDKTVFHTGPYENRKPFRMILASAPIKGVIPVRDTWLNVRRQFHQAELIIYSSQSLHDKQNTAEQAAFLKEMEEEGAQVRNPVPQHVLAEKMREAWCLLMPNSYPEICSNLLMQAQASGLPVVSSNIGSASEFITNGETGILTEAYPHDMWLWMKLYVESVVKLFNDKEMHKHISSNCFKDTLDWNQVGGKWLEYLSKLS